MMCNENGDNNDDDSGVNDNYGDGNDAVNND